MQQLSFIVPDDSARVLRDARAVEPPGTRLRQYGARSLTLDELYQLVLGVDDPLLAARVVTRWETLDALANADQLEVESIDGMTPARAARLLAAAELTRRTPIADVKPVVRSPIDLAHYLEPHLAGLTQERFCVVLLDTKMRIKGMRVVYQGSVHTTVIRIAEVFRDAITANVPNIAIAHNHPSAADGMPSPEDISVTREIVKAGQVFDITVVDHIIIGGRDNWKSLKELGLGDL